MKLFYIENTVDEREYRINGYFSTLEKAQEALKDCCDWYREKGTGKIYQVDMDVLNPEPVLVCKDGVIDKNYAHRAEMDFFILMKAAYIRYADSYAAKVDISKGGPGEFALDIYALGTEKYPGLLKFMRDHNIEPNDNEFNECFCNVKKEYETIKQNGCGLPLKIPNHLCNSLMPTEGIDSLIATARAISEQGKGLAEDLGKFKESYVME